jgi:hypothetical protein
MTAASKKKWLFLHQFYCGQVKLENLDTKKKTKSKLEGK